MYQPANRHAANAAFVWPALLAASASEMVAHFFQQFTNLAIGTDGETAPQPKWTTPHRVALELETVKLRDFATQPRGASCLLCTPFALHGSPLSDLAVGHSLVAALRDGGLSRISSADGRTT